MALSRQTLIALLTCRHRYLHQWICRYKTHTNGALNEMEAGKTQKNGQRTLSGAVALEIAAHRTQETKTTPLKTKNGRLGEVLPNNFQLYTETQWPHTFQKILVANRGEIACRVMRTCRLLGVKTVAVYSQQDRWAQHVGMADEAIYIGESASQQSYLKGDKLLEVAKQTGAQAIHPGYGFLSENAAFAEQCAKEGIVFIGPPASAIRDMGSKSASKRIMSDAGVPVVPGYHGDDQTSERLRHEAKNLGFPIMLKAVAGGGGKGMRIVRSMDEFDEALEGCKREALNSFKDDRVLLERYITRPRHIEFQIFADQHGNAVHLFERDCSVQRRHQKVLEEAPAPGMSDDMRAKMGRAAVDAAKAVGYVGAGTVEFIFDADTNDYFFMEMNTRLQVEHPVTEMIMRRDLVQLQLHVASGHTLPFTQDDILHAHGHAIEARIYAENPYNNFLPATGKLHYLQAPQASSDVRVESGIRQDDEVSIFYDPMIAKLVCWGPDRQSALDRMSRALDEYRVVGPPNNISFVQRCVNHSEFRRGMVDTSFIAANLSELVPSQADVSEPALIIANLYMLHTEVAPPSKHDLYSPWLSTDHYRPQHTSAQRDSTLNYIYYGADGTEVSKPCLLKIVAHGKQRFTMSFGNNAFVVESKTNGSSVSAIIDQQRYNAEVLRVDETLTVFINGNEHRFRLPELVFDQSAAAVGGCIAPMAGKVIKINAQKGQTVKKGAPLVIMEAMKMEHIIRASTDGVIESILCSVGDFCAGGKVLATLEAQSGPKVGSPN